MAGLVIGILLIASLLLVHFSVRAQPMPSARPLDVDQGLPLPEVAQASTVFSLTALFGAYLCIYLLLGIPALVGLATGTGLALVAIRNWIVARAPRTFEDFLFDLLKGSRGNIAVFALTVAGVQCAYAASELLILRDVARDLLGVRLDHATWLAIGLGIIAYFYVLFGGYMAVFRTDVLQFALVGIMVIVCLVFVPWNTMATGFSAKVVPRSGYWELPFLRPGPALYVYHFLVGLVMGFGFLAASPDAWKRVFLVAPSTTRTHTRFVLFLLVGTVPFLVLLPLGALTAQLPDGPIRGAAIFSRMLTNNVLFVAASLALVASFLSAFDSAFLASVHLGLMLQRRERPVPVEMVRFHWLMVTVLLTTFGVFMGFILPSSNPYFLANVLLGPYAVVAGVQVGSRGQVGRLRPGCLLWIIVVGLVGWFLYFVGIPDVLVVPTTYQINTVPAGVGLGVVTAATCLLCTTGDGAHGRGRQADAGTATEDQS